MFDLQVQRANQQVLLALENVMPRPKSDRPRKAFIRRTPAWCDELSRLTQRCAQLISEQQLYFTHSLEFGGQVNIAGVVQGVLLQAATAADTISLDQWIAYVQQFAVMEFKPGEVKGIYFSPDALEAINIIGRRMQTQALPSGVNVTWGKGYRYHMMIAMALLWFIDTHSKS